MYYFGRTMKNIIFLSQVIIYRGFFAKADRVGAAYFAYIDGFVASGG